MGAGRWEVCLGHGLRHQVPLEAPLASKLRRILGVVFIVSSLQTDFRRSGNYSRFLEFGANNSPSIIKKAIMCRLALDHHSSSLITKSGKPSRTQHRASNRSWVRVSATVRPGTMFKVTPAVRVTARSMAGRLSTRFPGNVPKVTAVRTLSSAADQTGADAQPRRKYKSHFKRYVDRSVSDAVLCGCGQHQR